MKITKLETIRPGADPNPNLLWVRVHTDEGLVGLGETFYIPEAVEAVVCDWIAPMILGASAFDRERIWVELFSYANFFGFAGAEMRAISAVDLALWDLAGQYLQQPVYNLMGGRCRERIPVYNTCVTTPLYDDADASFTRPGELAESLVEQGYRQMKIWPWDRFAPRFQRYGDVPDEAYDHYRASIGPPGHYLSATDLKAGLWTVQEIRRAVGDRIEIAIEGHSRWDVNAAIRIARALEPYDVVWMEDIIQPDCVADLKRLVDETRVPQCASERLFTRNAYRELLETNACHIVMPDVIWTGGLTESLKIAALADAHHLPIAPHDCTGPVNVFACLHLCMAAPNAMIMEVVRGFCEGWYRDVVDTPVRIDRGHASLDGTPGLGVRLRDEVVDRSVVRVAQ